ncbi:hypothetical protein QCA50_004309 [Cerrena zonata]|uniref:CCL2-like lectin domain-containing protein n=1 Tax=Cerrena zonata TaxID=2478898 RepID=A0AAW0GH48_9APHY
MIIQLDTTSLPDSSTASTIPDGDYVIYSRALSNFGQKLAISFNGNDTYATLKPLGYSQDQIWTLRNYNGRTLSVSPRCSLHLQAAWGSEGVKVMPEGNYVWTFTNNGEGFIIQDGDMTKYWGVSFANSSTNITIGDDDGQPGHRWILEKL